MIQTFKTIASIAWPSHRCDPIRDGWAVTLDLHDEGDDKISFHVRDCKASSDVLVLVGWAKEQKADIWFSDSDKRAMAIMAQHKFSIGTSPAPYIEAKDPVPLYLQILHQCLGVGKILYLGGVIGQAAKEQIIDLRRDLSTHIQDYPAAAALCYVVSAAYLWYRAPEKERTPTHAEHIIAAVESREDYEPWVDRFLNSENEVYGNDGLW